MAVLRLAGRVAGRMIARGGRLGSLGQRLARGASSVGGSLRKGRLGAAKARLGAGFSTAKARVGATATRMNRQRIIKNRLGISASSRLRSLVSKHRGKLAAGAVGGAAGYGFARSRSRTRSGQFRY